MAPTTYRLKAAWKTVEEFLCLEKIKIKQKEVGEMK